MHKIALFFLVSVLFAGCASGGAREMSAKDEALPLLDPPNKAPVSACTLPPFWPNREDAMLETSAAGTD